MRSISWFLFILGITLGFIFGLYYAWKISPLDLKVAKPSDLDEPFQAEYQTLIALAYVNTGNFSRAIRRLDTLPESNVAETLKLLAQKHLAEGRSEEDVLAVAQLAAALTNPTRRASTPQGTPTTTTPTASPTATPTRVSTPTQSPTPIPSYQLRSREKVCDPGLGSALIQVLVFDAAREPAPGVEVLILWEQGEDHFFTGLKPELSPGYGDFNMTQGITYMVRIAGSSETITGLEVEECTQDDQVYPGSWRLIFEEP